MEAIMMKSTGDYKHQIGKSNRNLVTNRSLYSYPSDDLLLASFLAGGHFAGGSLLPMAPASLSRSYPPAAVSVFRPPQNLHHHRQQPPLLPLPISVPLNHQNMQIYRSNSSSNNNTRSSPPRINKSVKNRGREYSLTPKKSKNQKKNLKREEADLTPPVATEETVAPLPEKPSSESSTDQMIGPDPKDLPKDVVSRVFSSSIKHVDEFSGSVVFTPSPPPSSLPLPTFSLRPKLSCTAEAAAVAAGVDAGATDSLRRLLRL